MQYKRVHAISRSWLILAAPSDHVKGIHKVQPVSEIVPFFLQRFRDLPILSTPVWRALWQSNMGPSVAAYTEVLRFRSGLLTVRVNHHAWHQQLVRLRRELIVTLNRACGKTVVMDIEFIYQSKCDSEEPTENPLP